jgi:lysophospholipase L1-like esterase
MFKHRWWFFVLAGLVGFVLIGGMLFEHYPPGSCRELRVSLVGPFEPTEGFEYRASLPADVVRSRFGSDHDGRGLSPLTLWEDGRDLHHAHAFRTDIQRTGKGAFLHWGETVYFSASDNSDPRTNGRTYQVRRVTGLPLGVYLSVLILGYILSLALLMAVHRRLSDFRWGGLPIHVCTIVVTVILVECVAWVLVENRLTSYGPLVRSLYGKAFSDRWNPVNMPHEPGLTLNYVPHHYLNYALNPDIAYCGVRQFNAHYHIRRTEPISPEKGARWRILAIGGSTTFGEGIPREEDNWPYLLETTIRARCEPQCEVINAGVGGYTLLENFIHYVVLLKDLKPDVVLLYTGINDVHPRLFGEIRTDYSNYRRAWGTSASHLWQPNTALAFSAVYRYYFLNKVLLRTLHEGIGGQVSRKGPPASAWPAALARNSERAYRNHLDDFIRLLTGQGIRVAILPQVFARTTDRDKAFDLGVDSHNRVNEELARQHGLPFAAELLSPGAFSTGDLADNCHFSEKGCRQMASLVFGFLQEHGLLPRCATH